MAGSFILPAGPSVDGSGGAPGRGPTRADYWQDLAGQIGRFQTFTVSSTATSGEGSRLVLVDELADDDVEDDEFRDGWLYVMDGEQAGAQRRILQSEGYVGPIGGLLLSRPFSSPLQPGTTVAVTSPLPVVSSRGVKGLVTLDEESLKRLRVDARIMFTGDGSHRVNLGAYPWINGTQWTDGIYDYRGETADRPSRRSAAEYDITVDGATSTLELARAYGPSDQFSLKVFAPADLLLFDGTAWGYSTSGLADDTCQAAAPVRQVTTVAMAKGLEYLFRRTFEDEHVSPERRTRLLTRYDRDWPQWTKAAERVIQQQPRRERDLPRRTVSVTGRLERAASRSGWRG